MTKYDEGVRQATELIRRSPGHVGYWLERARMGRRRWKTRLFLVGKRRFLNGFIAGLEGYEEANLEGRVQDSLLRLDREGGATDAMPYQRSTAPSPTSPEAHSKSVRCANTTTVSPKTAVLAPPAVTGRPTT